MPGCIEVSTTDAAASVASRCDPPRDGQLGMLAEDARFGSRGVARALVCAGDAAAASTFGAAAVTILVLAARGDLLAWYGRLGFADTGLRKDARTLFETVHCKFKLLADTDFIVMRKRLAAPRL